MPMSRRGWYFSRSAVVTDGGRGSSRSALACARALGEGGIRPLVTVPAGGEELAAASKWAERVEVPHLEDRLAYRRAILGIAAETHLPVFATSDLAMAALDLSGSTFLDKSTLAVHAAAAGIDVPDTVIISGPNEIHTGMTFPVVVKPVLGSLRAIRLDGMRDVARIPADGGPFALQPYLEYEMTAIAGVVWNGALVAAVHQRYERRWPVDCGTASAAVTVEHDPSREAALLSLLGDHQGIFQAQYLGSWLIDVNPRPYGSMPLATKAGVNFPTLVCALAQGDIEVPREVQRGRTGVRYRWVEGDVRHLAARLRAGSIGPGDVVRALTPHGGAAHSDVSIHDPRPVMLRVRQILRGVMHRQR